MRAGAALVVLLSCAHVYAQGYPSKSIRYLVPDSAGGGNEWSNRASLCPGHHRRVIHEGLALLGGTAPDGLTFRVGRREGVDVAIDVRVKAIRRGWGLRERGGSGQAGGKQKPQRMRRGPEKRSNGHIGRLDKKSRAGPAQDG